MNYFSLRNDYIIIQAIACIIKDSFVFLQFGFQIWRDQNPGGTRIAENAADSK